jgi:hypothetical protein
VEINMEEKKLRELDATNFPAAKELFLARK